MIKIKELPLYVAKLKNDAGFYRVWGIDWLKQTLIVYRAMEYETIPFSKVKHLMLEAEYFEEIDNNG